MLAMPFSGRLAHRYAFRPLVTVTMIAFCLGLVLTAVPTSLVLLCVVLVAFGAAAGLADMAMNAQGALVERAFGKSVMSSFHGWWSVGVLGGSVISAVSSHSDVDARLQFLVEAPALAAVAALAAGFLLEETTTADREAPPAFALPTGPVVLIGLVGLCAIFGEQAGTDWSAVFVQRELGGSSGTAALAVSAFAVTMAAVRLVGDYVIRRFGPVRTVRFSGICAAVGAVVVVLAPNIAVGLCGFALLGAGVALVVPLAFSAAGRVGPYPARSIAGVAGIAYAAGLAAPGMIGGIASASTLTVAFALVAGLVAITALGAGVLR
jgi:MFS family permease